MNAQELFKKYSRYTTIDDMLMDEEQFVHALSEAMCSPVDVVVSQQFNLPKYDKEKMRPLDKMPNCFRCGEDELSFINEDYVYCNFCGLRITGLSG